MMIIATAHHGHPQIFLIAQTAPTGATGVGDRNAASSMVPSQDRPNHCAKASLSANQSKTRVLMKRIVLTARLNVRSSSDDWCGLSWLGTMLLAAFLSPT